MSVIYTHLSYEDYKRLEEQMRAFGETTHQSTGGFYHKSIRLKVNDSLIVEFHGPLVGGYGHVEATKLVQPPRTIEAMASMAPDYDWREKP